MTPKKSGGIFDPDTTRQKIQSLEEKSSADKFWDDAQQAKKILREKSLLEKDLKRYEDTLEQLDDVKAIVDLLKEAQDDALFAEAKGKIEEIGNTLDQMKISFLFTEEEDQAEAVIEINAGAGGTESCDWASMLFRMYTMWANNKGFDIEVIEEMTGDEAGLKHVTFLVKGDRAYGLLKSEIGIHRLVRISPFDSAKRRHTSFASLYAYPNIEDEIVIDINPADLRIDTFRASGAGGQHVNKTDSAVRLTHTPTNAVVQCQSERSQHQNRERAMKLLKAKLYDLELKKRREAEKAEEDQKSDISWGNQIRSYVLHPYRMVKDHRVNYEDSNADAVLDGKIDEFISAVLKDAAKKRKVKKHEQKKDS